MNVGERRVGDRNYLRLSERHCGTDHFAANITEQT
jgi:hypothetical protein